MKDKIATHATQIRLPLDLRDRIATVAGKGRMAHFIRQAIEAELARREAAMPPQLAPQPDRGPAEEIAEPQSARPGAAGRRQVR